MGPVTPWIAPAAAGPVTATVRLPGSKSMTARALVLSALADGPSRIDRPLRARDTTLMAEGLQAAAVAGATRWAGRKLQAKDHRALRLTGQALTTAATLVPLARFARRRFA